MGCLSSKPHEDNQLNSISSPTATPSTSSQQAHSSDLETYELAFKLVKKPEKRQALVNLEGDEARNMVELLNKILDNEASLARVERKWILHALSGLCQFTLVFPECLKLTSADCHISRDQSKGKTGAYTCNGVYRGQNALVKVAHLQPDSSGTTANVDTKALLRMRAKEAILAAYISHPNILPLYGIYLPQGDKEINEIWTLWPRTKYGDLLEYLEKYPKVPRLPLISNIISGLDHLHKHEIVHGDLRAINILVSHKGHAILSNFNVSRVSMDVPTISQVSAGGFYWMAPEILTGDEPRDLKADIWAFACTCYEVLTHKAPFSDQYMSEIGLIMDFDSVGKDIEEGREKGDFCKIPELEQAFLKNKLEKQVWNSELMKKCWSYDPKRRPTTDAIMSSFSNLDKQVGEPIRSLAINRRGANPVVDTNLTRAVLQRLG